MTVIAYLCTLKGLDLLFIPPADHQGKEDLYRNKKIGQWKHEACGQLHVHVKYKCTCVYVRTYIVCVCLSFCVFLSLASLTVHSAVQWFR